jgi:hypothetical protein
MCRARTQRGKTWTEKEDGEQARIEIKRSLEE